MEMTFIRFTDSKAQSNFILICWQVCEKMTADILIFLHPCDFEWKLSFVKLATNCTIMH